MIDLKIFSGNSNIPLADDICKNLGITRGNCLASQFSDGETQVEIKENVRGKDVYVMQSISYPSNTNLMELLIMIDALKRASADQVTAVIPYYGYARQDRKVSPRAPITAKLIADLITTAGANRILTIDLHAGQIQGFFNIPVDNLFASSVQLPYIRNHRSNSDLVIVSPDSGGVERARAFAKRLGAGLAIIDKRRPKPNVSEVMHIIGDIKDKKVIILDDMIDTAGTITQAGTVLYENGASSIWACCTHPVLSGNAVSRLKESKIEKVIVTNTISLNPEAKDVEKIFVLSVADLLSEAIKRIYNKDSVSSLFV
ncbi:MAG: ribose-phosphate pyrophosphokinase [Thermodesulfobacteriota bacterium]|nr:ribose-phosphate pyrophosphokinase [Thermodesulfobacteriota bacterium]